MRKLIFLFLTIIFICSNVPATTLTSLQPTTDQKLKQAAIEAGIIPVQITKEYLDEQVKEGNVARIWSAVGRPTKLAVIATLKKMFEREGIIIKLSDAYYVDRINWIITENIKENRYDHTTDSASELKKLVMTVAAEEGDFDNGQSKVEFLKECLSEESFEQFKQELPEMYEKLVKMDKGE